MAGRTGRLGLSIIGGSAGGTITDDEQKYTSADRVAIDRAFVQTEAHDHKYHPLILQGQATPTTFVAAGGRLRGGQTFYYRVAMVESDGEGVAGPEVTVTLPSLLVPPGALATDMNETLPDPTGTLPPGLYYYALTALRGGEETPLGPALTVSLPLGQGGIRLALPAFGDADGVRVWRMHDSDAGYTKIAIVGSGTSTFTDDGSTPADPCSCDPGNTPPTANVGASNYAIELTLPAGITPLAGGWRIYRSTTSGIYPTSSLVHAVVELNDEDDLNSGVLKSWLDIGDPLVLGAPQDVRQDLRFQPFTFDSTTALPNPVGYPENYPLLYNGQLHVLRGGMWAAGVAGGMRADGTLGTFDLNDVVLTGTYQGTAANATIARNYPVDALACLVEVFQVAGATALTQRVTLQEGASAGRGHYTRALTAGVWSPWQYSGGLRVSTVAGIAVYAWDNVNGREQLISGDTGRRALALVSSYGWVGTLEVRRQDSLVTLIAAGLSGVAATNATIAFGASGFLPDVDLSLAMRPAVAGATLYATLTSGGSLTGTIGQLAAHADGAVLSYHTTQAWPTSLPGTAIGTIPNL